MWKVRPMRPKRPKSFSSPQGADTIDVPAQNFGRIPCARSAPEVLAVIRGGTLGALRAHEMRPKFWATSVDISRSCADQNHFGRFGRFGRTFVIFLPSRARRRAAAHARTRGVEKSQGWGCSLAASCSAGCPFAQAETDPGVRYLLGRIRGDPGDLVSRMAAGLFRRQCRAEKNRPPGCFFARAPRAAGHRKDRSSSLVL
jgi:hypothetical protein